MSVAFRRESDEEHLEPRFELPIPPGPNLVTARGLSLIQQQVDTLEAAVRDTAEGDERKRLVRDLRYWRQRLATAEVAPLPDGEEAAFGTRVRFRRNGREQAITIVGHDEADAVAGLVAFAAPLAQALMGAMAGERVPFAGKAEAIEVLEVGPPLA